MDQTKQLTGQENPDLLVILEDAPSRKIASQARSYECNFCKRGFSNAQALGGHMNIHRKDKAKLKQHSLKESTARRIPMTSTHPFLATPIVRTKQPQIVEASDSSGRYCCIRTNKYYSPWNKEISGSSSIGWGDTHVGKFQQMPNLLVDKLSSNQDHRQKPSNQVHDFNIDLGFSPSSHGLPTSELDLELRLGPEPLRGSVSSFPRGTIKFF